MLVPFLAAGMVVCALTTVLALLTMQSQRLRSSSIVALLLVLLAGLAAFPVASALNVAAAGGVVAATAIVAAARFRTLSPVGVTLVAGYGLLPVFSLPWSVWFVATMPVSVITRLLLLSALPLLAVALPVALARQWENVEVLCRQTWRRPRAPLPPVRGHGAPRVSIHVPAHAEPPDVVMATLDALAALHYDNYEVLVIDNNTTDADLWRPVQARCEQLGERFRFVHVEGLTGAKAGALNLAMRLSDPAAALIAVVDADYQADADFLSTTVGYFDDPTMGFVQSPHAYRDFDASRFLRHCRWEYSYFFATGMVSRNERDAAITVGTMSVIRRQALEDAGGWAEWCLTEDSELAIRIHACGYSGVYLNHVYGRGLIPETFAAYKKQRFRWTYGPVQELKQHWRLLFGRAASKLTPGQRLHHATHGLYGVTIAASAATIPIGAAAMVSMIVHREVVAVPWELWVTVTALLVGGLLQRWRVYQQFGASLRDYVGATVAGLALSHVIIAANVRAALGLRAQWERTDKFRRRATGWRSLRNVGTELTIAAVLLGLAVSCLVVLGNNGIAGMLAVGLLLNAMAYLAAPAMTLLAEHDLQRHIDRDVDDLHARDLTAEVFQA